MSRLMIGVCVLLLGGYAWAATQTDFRDARVKMATHADYQPDKLEMAFGVLMEKHFELADDPDASIDDLNAPLQELYAMYPLGIQVNRAIARFLEHIAENAEDPQERDELLGIARQRQQTAEQILASIMDHADGKAKSSAFQVINLLEKDAVLEHLQLEVVDQELIEEPGGRAYDKLTGRDASGAQQQVYFDVSLFIHKAGSADPESAADSADQDEHQAS